MNKSWINYLSIAITIAALMFGFFERSYAQALIKQVDRHELILIDNTKAVADMRIEQAKLIIEVRLLREALEKHIK